MSLITRSADLTVENDRALSVTEYALRYRAARREAAAMSIETRRKIAAIYREAADEAAAVVRDGLERGLSELTTERWAKMAADLTEAADAIASGAEASTRRLIDSTASLLPSVDAQYVLAAAAKAGATEITGAGVSALVAGVHDRVMASLVSRLWADGQTFSSRVWGGKGVRADWLERMRITVAGGIAQGRDPLKIARDIQEYTADGKVALLQRWGKLEAGTAEFAKRIPKNVDWRAVRLVRSELYASLQDSAVMAGEMNPGCDGLYDWLLQAGRENWDCDCEALADGGPYEAADVPTYPHPHCHPAGTMIQTAEGEKPIESLLPGDLVVGHDGSIQTVINTWQENYDGLLHTIATDDGEIEATSEHPLLSCGSWRGAESLKTGDYLSRVSIDVESLASVKNVMDDDPSGAFKGISLTRVLTLLSGSGMPIPAVDFNGELYILKSKIDVESPNGKIGERLFSVGDEGIVQHAFVGRPELTGKELRYAGLVFVRVDFSSPGFVRGSGIGLESSGVKTTGRLSLPGDRKTTRPQIAPYTSSGNIELLGYRLHRQALVPEELRQRMDFNVNSSTHNSAIVHVASRVFKGFVYNLSVTGPRSFIANGFASHNCACSVRPHLRDQKEFIADLKKWAQGGDVDYLDKWNREQYRAAA